MSGAEGSRVARVSPTPSYRVRIAEDDDLLHVVRLIERSPALTREGLSDRHRSTWDRMMSTPDLTVYLAHLDGEAVGTTSLLVMPHVTHDCRPTAFIEPLLVAEPHRRQGAARLMIVRVLDDARRLACRKVQVMSHKRHVDDGAHEFYRSMGFDPEAEGFRLYL